MIFAAYKIMKNCSAGNHENFNSRLFLNNCRVNFFVEYVFDKVDDVEQRFSILSCWRLTMQIKTQVGDHWHLVLKYYYNSGLGDPKQSVNIKEALQFHVPKYLDCCKSRFQI